MGLKKEKLTAYKVIAEFHTITEVNMNFSITPEPIIEDGEIVGQTEGSSSRIILSSYKDFKSYEQKAMPLERNEFIVDFITAATAVKTKDKTCEQVAYDIIKKQDPFWEDAETV